MSFLKRTYFILCYNSNRILNFNAILTIFIPILILLVFQGNVVAIIKVIGITITATALYVLIYLVNDLVDLEKDKKEKIYKFSLHSEYGISLLVYAVVYTLIGVVIVFQFRYFDLISYNLFLAIFVAIWILVFVALVHSYFPKFKKYTLFAERALKFLLPLYFVNLLYPEFNYFSTIALILPYILDKAYVWYLTTKRNLTDRDKISVYCCYYLIMCILYCVCPFDVNILLLLVFFLLHFWLQLLYRLLSCDWSVLNSIYGETSQARSEALTEIIVNWILLLMMIIWASLL